MRNLKVGFDRWLRRRIALDTAGVWPTAAVLAWVNYFFGSLATAGVLTVLVAYLEFGLSRSSQL